jgi:DNA repair protein RecO (recombination protein O)
VELINEPAVLTAVAAAGHRDRLLTFFTRGQGGVRLYARRPSPRAPATMFLEPLQGGELVFVRTREGERGRMHSFVPQRVWPGIRAELGRTVQALAFLELLNGMLAEGEPHAETFELLVGFLNRLEQERRPGLARICASLRLLTLAGFAPHLDSCTVCLRATDAAAGVLFSPGGGGIVCRECRGRTRLAAQPISQSAHGYLRRVLALPEAQARRLRVAPAVEREVSRLVDAFVEERTDVRPRVASALERLEAV